MTLSWSGRRKLLYGTVATVVVAVLVVWGYEHYLTQAPTCFDHVQNGDEHGVDCGGSQCALVCQNEARAPVVLWSRAFPVGPGLYTAAAYVQNPNTGDGARRVGYTFELFDEDNSLVLQRVGTIDIPPVAIVPFIDPNIDVGKRTVAKAIFSFTQTPVWERQQAGPRLRVGNQFLATDGSRLSATVYNDSATDAKNITVTGVLFDSGGVARAASRSLLSRITGKGSQDVVFTWPQGVLGIQRAEITVLPSF